MSIFDWQEDYVIDHAMIDEQHMHLLKLAENLFNSVISQPDLDITKNIYEELLAYTQKHFMDEEAFFESAGASSTDKHKKEHMVLCEELVEVWQKETLGFQTEKGRTLLNWVEERLLPHMMIDDQETFSSCSG